MATNSRDSFPLHQPISPHRSQTICAVISGGKAVGVGDGVLVAVEVGVRVAVGVTVGVHVAEGVTDGKGVHVFVGGGGGAP